MEGKRINNRKYTDTVVLFMLLTFSIPLGCSLLMLKTDLFKGGILNLILYGIEGASPTIAVLILMYIKDKKRGIKNYLIQKYKFDFSISLCVAAFLVPAAVLTIAKFLANLIMENSHFITLVSTKKIIIIAWALIAEELGWRAYLQDAVEKKVGVLLTPFLIGCIWTLWHYHFFLTGSMEVPIVAFAYGCIVESYGYYVITKLAKGNIVPASIWHFSGNLFFNLYLLDPHWNNGSMLPYYIVNSLYSVYIIAFIILLKKRKKRKILQL